MRHCNRLPVLALAGVLIALALAPGAQARLRINSGMEGIRLGMGPAEVTERIGEPRRMALGPDFVDWIYRRPPMTVTLKADVVTLFTRSKRIRGPRGIGVGSSERRLERVLGGRVACQRSAGQRLCVVGSFATGRRSTVFDMRRGRVTSITVSRSTR